MRRVLALVLCTCILFSLTACGNKKEEVGFVSLYSEMLSLNNVESSVDLSVSFDDVDEASLLLAKLTYLKEKGNLSDFDTVQDVYVKRASDFVSLVNGLSNSSISLQGSFEQSSSKDMYGDLTLSTGYSKDYDTSIGFIGNLLFVDSDTMVELYRNYMSETTDLAIESLNSSFDSLKESMKDSDFVQIPFNSISTADLKDSAAKCHSINSYLNKFVSKYCGNIVKENSKTDFSITLKVSEIKNVIKGIYDLAKEEPGDFFDCAKDLVVSAKSVYLIDGTENNFFKGLLNDETDVKKAKKDFVKKWKSLSFDSFYSEVISDDLQKLVDSFAGSELTMNISKDGESYKYSFTLKLASDSSKSALTVNYGSVVKSITSNSISLSLFDMPTLYDSFVEELSEILSSGEDNFELPSIIGSDEESENKRPVNEDVQANPDTDKIINIVPMASISSLASVLNFYNLSCRGMEESEFKDYIYSDFRNVASSVGFRLDDIVESTANHSYEMSVSSEGESLSMAISADTGRLSYKIKVPYVKPMITLQNWVGSVEKLTGLKLGNAYIVEMLKMAEDGVVSNDYLSYNMNSMNETLEYLITYTELEENAVLTFNIYTYLF